MRAARMLNHMAPNDARDLAIAEHERTSYFRVDKVKGNNAPPSKAVWRRFVNVELPNADDVGVVEPWNFPGQGEQTEAMRVAEQQAETIFLQLMARFCLEGREVNDRLGSKYAPLLFSREPEARSAKVGKRALEEAMRRLFVARRIRVEKVTRRGRNEHLLVVV